MRIKKQRKLMKKKRINFWKKKKKIKNKIKKMK